MMIKIRKRRPRSPGKRSRLSVRWFLAWGVHLYTAMGLVAAAGAAVSIIEGTPEGYRRAFLFMLLAFLIDATDGTLARRVRVKEVLPGFDGRRLDDLIDFLTYTCLPLLLLWRAGIPPGDQAVWLLVPLIASAYGFCQVAAKTDDGFFLGFPSYWNLVAFYLYVLRPPGWLAVAILVLLAVLTFVPARYLYPSQRGRLNRWTNLIAAVWTGLVIFILVSPWTRELDSEPARNLTLISLFFPIYYLLVSWVISVRYWLRRRRQLVQQEIVVSGSH